MFKTLARSWEFSKASYSMVLQHKQLIVLPIISGFAAILVMASFILPLFMSGTAMEWMQSIEQESTTTNLVMYAYLFAFYFCNYFVIVFFNSALVFCAMDIINGEEVSIGKGLSKATRRIHQIFGWAIFSAFIGVLLQIIENAHEKAGEIVAAIIGSAWTALTYFVVPVIVVEGLGPIEAFKSSVQTLKKTWGTALVGNFHLGFLGFLAMVPIYLLAGVIVYFGMMTGEPIIISIAMGMAIMLVIIAVSVSSTADSMFKVLLYAYATGQTVPEGINTEGFAEAFVSKKK